LAQAIESVLEQTYQNFELIVVDDGSTDNSREVIEAYKDRLCYFPRECWTEEALNAGIAQSKVRSFVSGCWWLLSQNKLAKVVAGFLDHPVGTDFSLLDFGKSRGFTHQSLLKALSQGDVRNLLLQRESTPGNYFRLAYRRLALKQVLPIPRQPRAADTYLTATIPFMER